MNDSESTRWDERQVTCRYNDSESTGWAETQVTCRYNDSESTGWVERQVTVRAQGGWRGRLHVDTMMDGLGLRTQGQYFQRECSA
jgi:hypothetical protein